LIDCWLMIAHYWVILFCLNECMRSYPIFQVDFVPIEIEWFCFVLSNPFPPLIIIINSNQVHIMSKMNMITVANNFWGIFFICHIRYRKNSILEWKFVFYNKKLVTE
jgi:hypothetical protein